MKRVNQRTRVHKYPNPKIIDEQIIYADEKRKTSLKTILLIASGLFALSFIDQKANFIDASFNAAEKQYQFLAKEADKDHKFPRTLTPSGQLRGTDEWDWTGGFFLAHYGISTTTHTIKKQRKKR
ncbi:hypothetical protein KUH03_13505 [Sphingobacterium sp. E70]|uniref:hypothetical protein n=1 Tax=Sphingobacterium sp. E70 TaxID=2853439 RepID=UPI00211C63B0|nr:hypothetical protein [Sphingobacterium sp. E70]ULT27625.1 hypothetical protein KUH03_13505 [Sphingobacterium sp. E70]